MEGRGAGVDVGLHVDWVCDAQRFLVRGRVVAAPRRVRDRDALLEHLASLVLAPGEEADEPAVSERIAALADDVTRWRRDLVEAGLLGRRVDGSRYWRERVTPHDDEPSARPRPDHPLHP